jgi:hypothetical protein
MRGSILTTAALALASTAFAQTPVTGPITTSVTLTNDQAWEFIDVVVVEPGATLTIEAGTVIVNGTNLGGSLVVARGGQLFVQGTASDPVIITSAADVATWAVDPTHPTGKDPKTGTWRQTATEWGSVAVLGDAYIATNGVATNVATPDAANFGNIEGLPATIGGVPNPLVQYGGANDNDDSGSIRYVSLRYAGEVLALQNELNGISLGGVGRDTDFEYVEVMNNVDDGIEIFGGTVNLRNFAVWNIGDDSLDCDQGWRGAAQFGLIVQGHSLEAGQGSGLGDNAIEIDGAEDSFWQPVTTTQIANLTVIGNPTAGDHLVALRDNANVQIRNSVFMNSGLTTLRNDGSDGDGAAGYGAMGTLSFAARFATPALDAMGNPTFEPLNIGSANPNLLYRAQSAGSLSGIYNSLFYNNGFQLAPGGFQPAAQTAANATANTVGVFAAGNNNVSLPTGTLPVTSLTQGNVPLTTGVGGQTSFVSFLDPRPAGDALLDNTDSANPEGGPLMVSEDGADGFLTATGYRGAFAPGNNWLGEWTASYAFGFTPAVTSVDLGFAKGASNRTTGNPIAAPNIELQGTFGASTPFEVIVSGPASRPVILTIGLEFFPTNFLGGTLITDLLGIGPLSMLLGQPSAIQLGGATDASGVFQIGTSNTGLLWPSTTVPGQKIYWQAIVIDFQAVGLFTFTQGVETTTN